MTDGLKWISCKFFLLAERNWQEKPPHEASPIASPASIKLQAGHGKGADGREKFNSNNKNMMTMYEDYDNREDFEEYGKHCWLLTPWRGYRSATIVGQTDKGYIVQVSSGAEIVVYPDEIEID